MSDKKELWCVHVIGPDDVIAYPDKASAEQEAAALNEMFAIEAAKHHGDANWPACRAEVILWPYSAGAHDIDMGCRTGMVL